MIIGLVVALPEETRTLTAHPTGKGCRTFIAPSILLACSGAGPGNARASALSLLSEGAEGLVSWGCAAALDETLAPGDLTLADTLVSENGEKIDLRSDWLNDACEVLSELRPSVVCLAESKALVVDSSGKAQLHRQTGADILDMETVAVAKVALERNVPFLAV
ncbi:MAG: phosphorylase family protein, partial [Gammaproteobacteria bacterium]